MHHTLTPKNMHISNPTTATIKIILQRTVMIILTILTVFALPIPNVIKALLVETEICAKTIAKNNGWNIALNI
jgi:hypothetical protein